MAKAGETRPSSFPAGHNEGLFSFPFWSRHVRPPPQPISHTTEMVIATIIGVAIGLTRDNFLLGAGIGIAVGVLMSIAKTVYVERKRRQR